jgi:hypothetical protein
MEFKKRCQIDVGECSMCIINDDIVHLNSDLNTKDFMGDGPVVAISNDEYLAYYSLEDLSLVQMIDDT